MSAEVIAKVVRDMKVGRVLATDLKQDHPDTDPQSVVPPWIETTEIVDVTAVYRQFIDGDESWNLYEDSVVRPPFLAAAYGWENRHGNAIVAMTVSLSRADVDLLGEDFDEYKWETMADTHVIDWEAVNWITTITVWCGGWSKTRQTHLPTFGPVALVKLAVDSDGRMLDASYICSMSRPTPDEAAIETAVVTKAITFLNCRNVEVLPPSRPKPERKRIDRYGVRVSEIHVMPAGAWRRRDGRPQPVRLGSSTPYGTVRGHVAKYGPAYGRKLLFGKYEGEFWIPQHARGSAEAGVVKHEYEVEA